MLRDVHVLTIPKSKEQDARKSIDDIRSALVDPLEKFEPKTDYSGIEKLAQSME